MTVVKIAFSSQCLSEFITVLVPCSLKQYPSYYSYLELSECFSNLLTFSNYHTQMLHSHYYF